MYHTQVKALLHSGERGGSAVVEGFFHGADLLIPKLKQVRIADAFAHGVRDQRNGGILVAGHGRGGHCEPRSRVVAWWLRSINIAHSWRLDPSARPVRQGLHDLSSKAFLRSGGSPVQHPHGKPGERLLAVGWWSGIHSCRVPEAWSVAPDPDQLVVMVELFGGHGALGWSVVSIHGMPLLDSANLPGWFRSQYTWGRVVFGGSGTRNGSFYPEEGRRWG